MADVDVRIAETARDVFGWNALRAGQDEAIQSVLDGHDTLVVMPTGAGKSAIYQIAGALLGGTTVVVSPLIALQIDQLKGLAEHPAAPDAFAINSSQGRRENENALGSLEKPGPRYVFVSPEQLARPEISNQLLSAGVGLFVVDEAHLVSQWGHDFRPDYLELGEIINKLGHPAVLALTATGSPPVRQEIRQRLGFRNENILTLGFDRPNLRLDVVRHEDAPGKRSAVVARARELAKPGLIYVPTHRDADDYSGELTAAGLRSAPYHAGHTVRQRRETQADFMAGTVDVVVATTAFGLGIDKADVRFVLHTAPSDSLDSYYQEIGRAGRDGEASIVELHYRSEDLGLRSFFAHGSSRPVELERLLKHLTDVSVPRTIRDLAADLAETEQSVARQVNLLREAGAVSVTDQGVAAVDGLAIDNALEAAARAEHDRGSVDASRLAMMRSYAETRRCRRQELLGYFGEQLPEPCGNCDTCARGTAYEIPAETAGDNRFLAGASVQHALWGAGSIMHEDESSMTVYFETVGYKVLSRKDVEERHLLTLMLSTQD